MPNRLIKDSIHTSDTVNAMTDFQFRIWVNLITYVDDFGRGDARPAVIKGLCFPLLEAVTPENVRRTLLELERMDCIHLYRVSGKPYLCFPKWSEHQTIRNQKSKYPGPEEADADDGDLRTDEINCEQLKSTASKCPRNPIQSNPNPNPNPNPNTESEQVVVRRAREEEADMNSPWRAFACEYENNIGLLPTSETERGDLEMFFEEFTEDGIGEFIRFTARKHPDNPHVYFASLCRKYLGKGIRTAAQAKAALMDYERQRKGGAANGNGGRRAAEPPRPIFGDDEII